MRKRQHVGLLDNVATSSGTTLLLGVASLVAMLVTGSDFTTSVLWVVIAAGLLIVIRRHNLTLNNSPIACGILLLLTAASSAVDFRPWENLALAASALAGMELLFECYQRPKRTTLTYTAMLIAGTGMAFSWAYAPLAIVFLIGAIQMRAFSPRVFVAMLLGLITGPLLLFGFGLMPIAMPAMPVPETSGAPNIHLIISAGASILACLIFGSSCILTSYGYPAKARAFNGMVYVMTICVIACAIADATNADLYLGLLNICAAYHIGHFAVSHSRGWVTVSVCVIAIIALFIWNL